MIAPLLLFPGLGADSRLYGPQRSLPFPFEVAEWIEPESSRETLGHYAERMAKSLPGRKPVWVGGVSLGAMVALEAARAFGARGVILIGGCTSHRQISPLFRAMLGAGAAISPRAIRPSLALAPPALKLFERLSREQVALMKRMLKEHSPAQIRWSCRAVLQWECCQTPPASPVEAIHGENDEVIPLKNVKARHIVPRGRHLISLAHAPEVNRFVAEIVLREEGFGAQASTRHRETSPSPGTPGEGQR